MLKFIWGKGHQPTAERVKLQKELFGFSKVSVVPIRIGGGGFITLSIRGERRHLS